MKASFEHEQSRRRARRSARWSAAGWCDGVTIAVVRRARRLPVRRGDRAARGRRRSPAVPAHRPAVPPRPRPRRPDGRRIGGDRRARRPRRRPTSHRHWSTTSRRSPTSPAILAHGVGVVPRAGDCRSRRAPSSARSRGHTRRHGVAEVPMGTPLTRDHRRDRWRRPARGARSSRRSRASPTRSSRRRSSTRRRPTRRWPAIGSGLGAAGFIVLDDEVDPVAAAHAVARFLAVESCGQCEPCKLDGLAIADHLDAIRNSKATDDDLDAVRDKVETVDRGARCALAQQQRRVVTSALALFPDCFDRHLAGDLPAATAI